MKVIAIANASHGKGLHLEVCPCWDTTANACACEGPKDHRHFTFSLSSGDPNDTRTPAEWAQACALEARRLVAHELREDQRTEISALIGSTGT